MFGQDVHISLPPAFFFEFPPDPSPWTVPPPEPTDGISFKSPIRIAPEFYNAVLNPKLPVVFSLVYILFVTTCNYVNRQRGNKPWTVSRRRAFHSFVIAYNIAMAAYSAVTCAALVRAIHVSWPGFSGQHGLPGAADALCKMHGPRGYGDATTYDVSAMKWTVKNKAIRLAPNGLSPDPTDVGRIWNEGLAFWGWLFYLSKYLEVVDTLIILLKGKRCTTLQKYHHAGAMLCMWAGIRYMSPPIWMFVLVNSGIHALMYSFYTASAMGVRVRPSIKQFITTLQIAQFLVGASYAAGHLFVSYMVPVSMTYKVASIVSAAAGTAGKAVPSAASNLFSSASIAKPYSRDLPVWLKRLAYRAAGAEGLAETLSDHTDMFGRHQSWVQRPLESLSYVQSPANLPKLEEIGSWANYQLVRCLDTSGEAFAIWLNVLYLAPLTLLFLRFFWKSYIVGASPTAPKTASERVRRLSESAKDAARKTTETVESFGQEVKESVEGAIATMDSSSSYSKTITQSTTEVRESLVSTEIQEENHTTTSSRNSISDRKNRSQRGGMGGVDSEQNWFGGGRSLGAPQQQELRRSKSERTARTELQDSSWSDIQKEDGVWRDEYASTESSQVNFGGRIAQAKRGGDERPHSFAEGARPIRDGSWGFGLHG